MIDSISLMTTPIHLLNNSKVVSQGTGFLFSYKSDQIRCVFLVTNYHVLTGHAPSEIHNSVIGDHITFQIHKSPTNPSDVATYTIPLYVDGKRTWFTNPTYHQADLAVISLPASFFYGLQRIFCVTKGHIDAPLVIRPSSTISVIGYPHGYYDTTNCLPVWKTGSIASEPLIDFEGKPLFLIDVSAFSGMSGSPVFAISYGTYEMEEGVTNVGGVRKFLGIYASNQILNKKLFLEQLIHQNPSLGVTNEVSLQIGHVWKADLIYETIEHVVKNHVIIDH